MEEAEAPFRCRLQRDGLKFSRDIANWEKRAPVRNPSVGSRKGQAGKVDGDDSITDGSVGGGDGAGFFAFPLVVHSSHAHHVVRKKQSTGRHVPILARGAALHCVDVLVKLDCGAQILTGES